MGASPKALRAPVPETESVTSLPPVLPLAVMRSALLPSPAGSALRNQVERSVGEQARVGSGARREPP